MRSRPVILFTALSVLTVGLFLLDLAVGAVRIPVGDVWAALTGGDCPRTTAKIVLNIRLIKAVVALLAGAAGGANAKRTARFHLLFRNPLAGPYVLGISSGASLGVALVVLAGVGSSIGIAGAAWLGAAVVLLVIAAVGHRIKDIMVILILGMMFSSGVSAVVQILQYLSKEEALKAFVIWTMGSLGDVTVPQLAILLPSVIVGLLLAVWTIKPLNLLLFGEEYAVTMGLNIRRSRGLLFLSTTLLAGTVTAFCGPIGFIGLAMPHVARMLFREADHRVLLPGTLLSGAAVLLLCDIVSKMFTLPVNAITALLGIPIVVWVVLRNKSMTV
jgi:iron complex transport system permease protein